MAKLEVPIQINLPDDWVEQIVERLRNDPDADMEKRQDLISRQQAIATHMIADIDGVEVIPVSYLRSLPSVDPEPSQLAKDIARILGNDQDMRVILKNAESEIVRCKDCKHLQKWRSEESAKKFGQIYECARNVLNCPKPEDFCSRAERREDE